MATVLPALPPAALSEAKSAALASDSCPLTPSSAVHHQLPARSERVEKNTCELKTGLSGTDPHTSLVVRLPKNQRSPSSLRPNDFLRRKSVEDGSSMDTSTKLEVQEPKSLWTHRPNGFVLRTHDLDTSDHSPLRRCSDADTESTFLASSVDTCESMGENYTIMSSGGNSMLDSSCSSPLASEVGDFEDYRFQEVNNTILAEVPEAQVVLICSTKPENVTNLKVIDLLDPLELPSTTKDLATFLLVEDNQQCVDRASKLLRSSAGEDTRLVVLLADPQVTTEDSTVPDNIMNFMNSGAHDAVAWPRGYMDMSSLISTSLARAAACKQNRSMLARKVAQARQQSDRLFWKHAHDFLEGFPEMKAGVREVQGKVVGNLLFDKKLGQGSFGTVYAYKDLQNEDREPGAAKVISKADVSNCNQLFAISAEYHTLRKLGGHPNVVQAHGFLHGKQNLYIFMEMVGTTTLCNFLKQIKHQHVQGLPETQVHSLFKCVADGLAHCHELKVAHCDLKPENVVLAADGSAKIVDFGEAVRLDEDIEPLTHPVGTMPFQAPEILTLQNPWNPAMSDVWSLGVVLMELMCGYDALPRIMGWPKKLEPVPERAHELMAFFADFGTDAATESHALLAVTSLSRHVPALATREILIGMLQLIPQDRMLAADVAQCMLDQS